MANWHYTDFDAVQHGPVEDEELLDLNRRGTIHANSLVWKEGFGDWVPFRDVAGPLFGEDEEGRPVEVGVCAYSNRIYPTSEMIPYGEAVIGEEFKEPFIQELMESGSVEIADATEDRFEYVGFWWRTLSSFLDYLIKMIPSWICMIPYYIVAFTGGLDSLEDDPSVGALVRLGIAYGVGLLGLLAVSIVYETWLVGKYGGTLGKLIIGARVVNPDGSRLTYKRAFLRWLAKKPMNYVLVWGPASLGFGLAVSAISAASGQSDGSAVVGMAIFTAVFIFCGLLGLCSGVYWMAAFDPEKRTLHDRVVSTRVIKK